MTANLSRRRIISYAQHAANLIFTDTPGTLLRIIPEEGRGPMPARKPLARNPRRDDGRMYAPMAGALDLAKPFPLNMILRGLSGNTGAAIASATTTDAGQMLETLFGAAATDPSGAATTATGGNGATPNITVTSGTNIPDGMAILVPGTSPTENVVREVVSGGGTGTLVVDRTFANTITNGGAVGRAAKYLLDTSIHEHRHCYFRDEVDGLYRRNMFGGMSKGELQCPNGGLVRLVTSWLFTDVTDSAEENPTVTEATAGNGIVNVNSKFYVGNEAFLIRDLAIDFGGKISARPADNGPHGLQGYVVTEKMPVIRGKLYMGTGGATFGEIADSTGNLSLNKMQAWDKNPGEVLATYDIAVQLGTALAGCAYMRAPAAVFTKAEVIELPEGLEGIEFELACVAPSSGSPFRFHLF